MVYTIGTFWAVLYFLMMLGAIIGGLVWVRKQINNREKPIGGLILTASCLVFLYLWLFAAMHFRVQLNERALLVNTVDQTLIGVKEHGVQNKPLIGVSVIKWPAHTQYKILANMKGGTESATTKNGTSVYVDVALFLDLSKMDISSAYRATNGNFDTFFQNNLAPGLLSISRSVSEKFYTSDHTFMRDKWEKQYEDEIVAYLSDPDKGFNIKLVTGRTIQSWDFVNQEDAKAYDDANRAAYQVAQKENEKAALQIDKEMSVIRNEIINKTADGTIVSLEKMSNYLKSQPIEIRPYLLEYLNSMADMEYLRIVAQEKPEMILPPHGSVIASASSSANTSEPAVPQEKK